MLGIKANKQFNEVLVCEIEAFGRDLKRAAEQPMKSSDHANWIKGLSDLSRVLDRHLPQHDFIPMPTDVPIQVPEQIQQLQDLRGKLKIG